MFDLRNTLPSLAARLRSSVFSPAQLFAGGEAGGWYDPSDVSTLWQDEAGTVAVTADGDPVARMDDKSGNANHATVGVDEHRAIYRTNGTLHWLRFDGVDDVINVPAAILDTTQTAFTQWFAFTFPVGGGSYIKVFLSDPKDAMGQIDRNDDTQSLRWAYGQFQWLTPPTTFAAGEKIVLRGKRDDFIEVAFNGSVAASAGFAAANLPALNGYAIGDTAAVEPYAGDFFGAVLLSRLTTDAEDLRLAGFFQKKTGLTW